MIHETVSTSDLVFAVGDPSNNYRGYLINPFIDDGTGKYEVTSDLSAVWRVTFDSVNNKYFFYNYDENKYLGISGDNIPLKAAGDGFYMTKTSETYQIYNSASLGEGRHIGYNTSSPRFNTYAGNPVTGSYKGDFTFTPAYSAPIVEYANVELASSDEIADPASILPSSLLFAEDIDVDGVYNDSGCTEAATWLVASMANSSTGEIQYLADENTDDSARKAYVKVIALGENALETDFVFTITQPEAGGKTEYTATLAISSGVTANTTLKDDKNNVWTLTAVTENWTSNDSYIHIGTNKKNATSLTLSTDAYSSVDIKEIHVWAAAKASTNVTTKISIDGSLLGTSSVLSNTIESGGTEYYISNSTNESGIITVEISRPSSATGAIYFKKLEVIYEN